MGANLLISCISIAWIASSPWSIANFAVIHLFLMCGKLLIYMSSLLVLVFILLVESIVVSISFIVKLIDCLLMIPVLIFKVLLCISILVFLFLWVIMAYNGSSAHSFVVKTVYIRGRGSSWLFHVVHIHLVYLLLLLFNLLIILVDFAIYIIHPVISDIFPIVIVLSWV